MPFINIRPARFWCSEFERTHCGLLSWLTSTSTLVDVTVGAILDTTTHAGLTGHSGLRLKKTRDLRTSSNDAGTHLDPTTVPNRLKKLKICAQVLMSATFAGTLFQLFNSASAWKLTCSSTNELMKK